MTQTVPQIKKQLKQLKLEKGIVSKKIGDAKNQKLPIDHLIEEVKSLSVKIKNLEATLKESLSEKEPKLKKTEEIPSQFKIRSLPDKPDLQLQCRLDIKTEVWENYINNHPNSTIYHSSAIKKVITDTFKHESHYLAAVDENSEIHGVLPLIEMKSHIFGHFMVSLPYFNYGGILASSIQARDLLLKHASFIAQQQDIEHIEYRHSLNELDLPVRSEKAAMILNLPESKETLWNDIGSKVRAQIKKAQRSELKARTGRDELLKDFYRVFSTNMRDLGTPVYSKRLFSNMLAHIKNSYIIVIYKNEKPVSVAFLVGWINTLEIPWASTLRAANKYDSNMFLYWEVLKLAINQGYSIFDFGRSSKQANTYQFKKQWGARPYDLFWHYWLPEGQQLPKINPDNPKYKMMINAWKKLPLIAANNMGPHIVRNIP